MWPFFWFTVWLQAFSINCKSSRAFNRSGTTRALALDVSKAFRRAWHAGLLQKVKSYGTSGPLFGLPESFLSYRRLRVDLDGKSSQEYPEMLEFLKASLLILHFPYFTLMTSLMMLSVILLYMLMTLLSTLSVMKHLICGN